MDNLKHVRDQGRMALAHNKEHEGDTAFSVLSAHDCPYGPGDNRDAWLEGFGGAPETTMQADTSTPSADDVRHVEPNTVKEPGKPKGSKKEKAEAAKDATTVTTGTTGTAETALATHVEPTNPEAQDIVPTPDTIIGDPAASQGPGDGNVMHAGAGEAGNEAADDASKLM